MLMMALTARQKNQESGLAKQGVYHFSLLLFSIPPKPYFGVLSAFRYAFSPSATSYYGIGPLIRLITFFVAFLCIDFFYFVKC